MTPITDLMVQVVCLSALVSGNAMRWIAAQTFTEAGSSDHAERRGAVLDLDRPLRRLHATLEPEVDAA